jgi:hypothetical protein
MVRAWDVGQVEARDAREKAEGIEGAGSPEAGKGSKEKG